MISICLFIYPSIHLSTISLHHSIPQVPPLKQFPQTQKVLNTMLYKERKGGEDVVVKGH